MGKAQTLASGNILGTSIRASPTEALSCFSSLCSFVNQRLDRVQDHILKEHNSQNSISVQITLFPDLVDPGNTLSSIIPIQAEDSANLESGEGSASDVASPSGLGPIRGRQLYQQSRPTPYERGDESSSPSPFRRSSLASLSPLQITTTLGHISPVTAPSPLQKLAYSHPPSPTPPILSDEEMNIDEPIFSFNEKDVLAKASFTIVPLPYLHKTPLTRLIVCTKCECGVLPSSLLNHAKEHSIKLMSTEKQDLQTLIANTNFLDDSNEIDTPTPPCPPIEGILIQNGFSCNLCNYCCTGVRTMRNHFSEKHKDAIGFAKNNSKSVKVQALFARRPKYFAVTPSLRGLNDEENGLFSIYLRQCVPEIEALKILIPPITENEVPPLLKVTQWHEHLKDYTRNRDSVQKLLELIKLPTSREGSWLGLPLRTTIEGYMKDVRAKANNASIGIKRLLKECPRFFLI